MTRNLKKCKKMLGIAVLALGLAGVFTPQSTHAAARVNQQDQTSTRISSHAFYCYGQWSPYPCYGPYPPEPYPYPSPYPPSPYPPSPYPPSPYPYPSPYPPSPYPYPGPYGYGPYSNQFSPNTASPSSVSPHP